MVVRNRRYVRGSAGSPFSSFSGGMTRSGASYSMFRRASAGASTDRHLDCAFMSKIMGSAETVVDIRAKAPHSSEGCILVYDDVSQ